MKNGDRYCVSIIDNYQSEINDYNKSTYKIKYGFRVGYWNSN